MPFLKKLNIFLSVKRGSYLGGSYSIPYALNLAEIELQIHNFTLSLDLLPLFSYTTHMPSFSREYPELSLNVSL